MFLSVVIIECPADFSISTDSRSAYSTNVTWPTALIHGYEGQMMLTSNYPQETSFTIGDHVVIWTASHGKSFATNCNFTISVLGKDKLAYVYWRLLDSPYKSNDF